MSNVEELAERVLLEVLSELGMRGNFDIIEQVKNDDPETFQDIIDSNVPTISQALRDAERLGREAEREECAVLCEHHYSEEHDRLRLGLAENFDITRGRMNIALELSDFIRSRTTPEGEGEGA